MKISSLQAFTVIRLRVIADVLQKRTQIPWKPTLDTYWALYTYLLLEWGYSYNEVSVVISVSNHAE